MTTDNNDLSYPWVEEYRPKKIEDVIGAEHLVQKFNEYINSKSLPHLLFLGSPGTGKTTVAKILANEIAKDDFLYINASGNRSIDIIRNEVQDFCSTASFNELKIVILDEADGLTVDAQKMLRAVTEQFAKTCRFIMTANYEQRIIEPVRGRFQTFVFKGADRNQVAKRCVAILKQKGVEYNDETKDHVIQLVKAFYPDIRSTINNLQKGTFEGKFRFIDSSSLNKTNTRLIELVKQKSVRLIREEILSPSMDYDGLYNTLYVHLKEYAQKDHFDEVLILLAQYQYQNATHANRELNFVACLVEIFKYVEKSGG